MATDKSLWSRTASPKVVETPEVDGETESKAESSTERPEPAAKKSRKAAVAASQPTISIDALLPDVEEVEQYVVRTYRVRAVHDQALRRLAFDLRDRKGGGRADSSDVLRTLLDKALGIS